MKEYYTAREAAELLGLKYPTLLSRVRKGHIKKFNGGGWSVLIPREEIKKHANAEAVEEAGGKVLLPLNKEPNR